MPNNHQSSPQNSVTKKDENFFIKSEDNLDIKSNKKLISNKKDKYVKLIFDVEKTK